MTPSLYINPLSDAPFEDRVRDAIAAGADTPVALEASLRQAYPGAVVHERQLAAEASPHWYVYRDGRWTPDE